jgi:hypothetical protein
MTAMELRAEARRTRRQHLEEMYNQREKQKQEEKERQEMQQAEHKAKERREQASAKLAAQKEAKRIAAERQRETLMHAERMHLAMLHDSRASLFYRSDNLSHVVHMYNFKFVQRLGTMAFSRWSRYCAPSSCGKAFSQSVAANDLVLVACVTECICQ